MATQQELKTIADVIGKTMRSALRDHENRMADIMSNAGGQKKGSRRKKDDSPTASKNANQRLTGSIRNLNKHVGMSQGLFKELNDQLKRNIRMQNKNEDEDSKRNRRIKEQLELFRRTNASVGEMNESLKNLKVSADKQKEQTDENTDGLERFGDGIKNLAKEFLSIGTAGNAIRNAFTNAQTALATGGILGLDTYSDALMMAMNPNDLLELQARFRTDAMRVAGGTRAYTDTLRESQQDLMMYSRNMTEAAQTAAAMRSSLMSVGVSFEQASDIIGSGNNGLVGQFKQLSAMTGQTIAELNNGMSTLINNDESRVLLQKMTEDQRADYLMTQARMRNQLTVMTGSLERADELIRAQQGDASRTFLERFRNAALQSAAAMRAGMSAEDANRLGQLTRMNPSQLTDDQRNELISLRGQVAESVRDMTGSANAYQEIMGNMLRDRFNVDQLDAYNTELDRGLDPNEIRRQIDQSLSSNADNETIKGIYNTIQSIESIQHNALISLMAIAGMSAINTVGRGLASRMSPGHARRARNARNTRMEARANRLNMTDRMNLLGRNSSIAAAAGWGDQAGGNRIQPRNPAGRVAGGLSRGLTSLRMGTVGGLASMGAGMAIDHFWTPESQAGEQTKNTVSGALEGAAYGAMVGSVIPVVGTAVGAAVGGVIGGIAGFMSDTVSDEERDIQRDMAQHSEARVAALDGRLEQATNQHAQLMDTLGQELNAAQEAQNTAEIRRIQERMNMAELDHRARMDNLQTQKQLATQLGQMYAEQAGSLSKERNFQEAFDAAIESDWRSGQQFDMGEFKNITGMQTNEIVSDILSTLEPNTLNIEEIDQLTRMIEDGAEIEEKNNEDLFNALQTYSTQRQQRFDDEQQRRTEQINRTRSDIEEAEQPLARQTELMNTLNNMAQNIETNRPGLELNRMASELVTKAQNNTLRESDVRNVTLTNEQRDAADTNNDGTLTMVEKLEFILQELRKSNEAAARKETVETQRYTNNMNNVGPYRPEFNPPTFFGGS